MEPIARPLWTRRMSRSTRRRAPSPFLPSPVSSALPLCSRSLKSNAADVQFLKRAAIRTGRRLQPVLVMIGRDLVSMNARTVSEALVPRRSRFQRVRRSHYRRRQWLLSLSCSHLRWRSHLSLLCRRLSIQVRTTVSPAYSMFL